MGTLEDRLRQHRADMESELTELEAEAVAAGRERFDLAQLERHLGANPGDYKNRGESIRRDYYIVATRLKTMAELAEHVREMQLWGFYEDE